MHQKGIAQIIVVLLILSAVTAGSVVAVKTLNQRSPESGTPTEPIQSSATPVVKSFCENAFKGEPALNDPGVMQALGLLSQRATKSISMIGPSPSAALMHFINVQNIPDKGFTIDETLESGQKAIVKTTWNYSSGPIKKTFTVVKENDEWKIDLIQ